jgi:membrane fusion protein (multidrug efflux system)
LRDKPRRLADRCPAKAGWTSLRRSDHPSTVASVALCSVGSFVGQQPPSSARSDPVVPYQREILELEQRLGGDLKAREAGVQIVLADGSRYDHPGTVNFVDVTANQGTDSVLVRASFPNPDRFLVDGQLVSVVAEAGQPEPTLMIQQSALQADRAGIFVLVVNKDNKIEVHRVEIGPAKGNMVSVLKGLSEGDMVVTQGVQKVRPDQVVAPSEAN